MDSCAACSSCAMPTADESNHSAAGMPHPYCSTTYSLSTLLCTVRFPPSKNLSLPVGESPPAPEKIFLGPTQNGISGIHPLNYYCYYLRMINLSELVYSHFDPRTLQSPDTSVPNPNLYPKPNPYYTTPFCAVHV